MKDITEQEQIIAKVLVEVRNIQDYLWERDNVKNHPFDPEIFRQMFQKRVDKISNINPEGKHYKTELRKRLLQQAALSVLALEILSEL